MLPAVLAVAGFSAHAETVSVTEFKDEDGSTRYRYESADKSYSLEFGGGNYETVWLTAVVSDSKPEIDVPETIQYGDRQWTVTAIRPDYSRWHTDGDLRILNLQKTVDNISAQPMFYRIDAETAVPPQLEVPGDVVAIVPDALLDTYRNAADKNWGGESYLFRIAI